MTLLDLGCGPGSITAGLAEAVAPGPAIGVDLDPALPPGADGVRLVRADVCAIPLADMCVDAVFASALLQHLPDPLAALREARRVARPGAVIGVVDADWDGYLLNPPDPLLVRSLALMKTLRSGNPHVGRQLRDLLVRAGFTAVDARARAIYHGNPDEVRDLASSNASFFGTPAIADRLVTGRLATAEQLTAAADGWLAWGGQPGSFFAAFWCEAIGFVPARTTT